MARSLRNVRRMKERSRTTVDAASSRTTFVIASPYLPVARMVLVAEQRHRVDERADLALGRLDEHEAQVELGEDDVDEVARDAPPGRQDDDAARVRVLTDVGARRGSSGSRPTRRARGDRRLVAGQEVPALLGARAAPSAWTSPSLLLPPRAGASRASWNADGDDVVVIAANRERVPAAGWRTGRSGPACTPSGTRSRRATG